jgi:hypothetical protein
LAESGFKKASQIIGIVSSYSENSTSEPQHDAIPAPEIPHPTAPQAHVDATAVQDCRLTNLHGQDAFVADALLNRDNQMKMTASMKGFLLLSAKSPPTHLHKTSGRARFNL